MGIGRDSELQNFRERNMEETKSPMTQQQRSDFIYTGSVNTRNHSLPESMSITSVRKEPLNTYSINNF